MHSTAHGALCPWTVEQEGVEVWHEVRLHIVERDGLWAAAFQPEFEPPRLVVVLVPVRACAVRLSLPACARALVDMVGLRGRKGREVKAP